MLVRLEERGHFALTEIKGRQDAPVEVLERGGPADEDVPEDVLLDVDDHAEANEIHDGRWMR